MLRTLSQQPGRLLAIMVAALVAGSVSTLVQVVLWVAFADAWPELLARDARLAAALVLGPGVLPPPFSFETASMLAATAVHGVLSLAYAAVLALLVSSRSRAAAWLIGATFGVVLYVVNMHGFTMLFPWFTAARGWITVVAHVAFGISGALAYHEAARRLAAQSVPDKP